MGETGVWRGVWGEGVERRWGGGGGMGGRGGGGWGGRGRRWGGGVEEEELRLDEGVSLNDSAGWGGLAVVVVLIRGLGDLLQGE